MSRKKFGCVEVVFNAVIERSRTFDEYKASI